MVTDPPFLGGGGSLSLKEITQESTVAGGFQELAFWSLELLRSDDQPLNESQARIRDGSSRGSAPHKTAMKPAKNSRSNTIISPNLIIIIFN